MIKKIFKSLLYIVVTFLIFLPLYSKYLPIKITCNYSTKITGQSMDPILKSGTTISLTRCFKEPDLKEGTIVLFSEGSSLRLGIIRHILKAQNIIYKISDEKTLYNYHDLIITEIKAITNNISTTASAYKTNQNISDFTIKPNEYLKDFYLAKIPKDNDIDKSIPEKTESFSIEKDKFCYSIFPKKDLFDIDIEIINIDTSSKFSLGTNIVFTAATKPNINCDNLTIKSGKYQIDFLLKHQLLVSKTFTVF